MIYLSRSRADRRLGQAGTIAVGITLLWALAATLIDTPAERLYAAHTALSDAVKRGDVDKIVSYLAPDFTTINLGIGPDSHPKELIAAILKENGVKETKIISYTCIQKESSALTSINVLTTMGQGSFLSGWQLSWDDMPHDDWKIRNARLLTLNNEKVPENMLLAQ